ncbi:outer membrane protein [Sphingomonas mesophila]|uniref:outer membrane protein n=1 Tax=Sphingomonas mesophila TaxID=2303576 RepID=UPI000E57A5F0|nr:outer membrane beta-barrel protein [Sphingomonas mesophila]
MRTKLLVALGAATLLTSPAFAADFAGPRAELRGGWDKTTIDVAYDDGEDEFSDDGSDTGFNIGAEIGYDAKIGTALIAGVYAGIEGATTKDCGELYGDDEACLKLGRNFTLGGRLGAAVTPNAMLYVKGGYSNGQLKATYDDFLDDDFDYSDKANRDGFHFGVGGELAVSTNGYVRAEYVRTNYDDYDNSEDGVDINVDSHRDQILFGFGLRF